MFRIADIGSNTKSEKIKGLCESDVASIFNQEHLELSGKANIAMINNLSEKIKEVEKAVVKVARLKEEYKMLMTVPGIGKILALTIMLETGPIDRFAKVGNYVSYCRCVNSKWFSNGKAKGKGNRKNGNKYLSWAYLEAANFATWHHDYAKRYYQKKTAKTNNFVAIKAIAHKLSRACYYIMQDQKEFNPMRAFV